MSTMKDLWAHLSGGALLWLTLTLVVYTIADRLSLLARRNPLANPVLHSVWVIGVILVASGTPYETYFDGAYFIHFLLGPATVALAIPLHAQWPRLKAMAGPLIIALVVGSLTAALSAWGIGAVLGASRESLMSLAPKSVTTPIAMGVAERIGGLPSLTAVLVISTGIIGAVFGRSLYQRLHVIQDHAVRGFAIGIASHGIGTARAFQVSEQAGAFAALAMGLNGLLTAVSLPWIMPWVERLFAR